MSDYQMFEAIVRDVEQITAQVKRFTLVSPTGAPLPGFSGGSHIIVQMQDGEQRYSNAYSLMSSPLDTTSWQIAVRLESPSKGGSRFMHQQVRPGDTLTVSTPNNLFAIEPQARKHLLIAGGIGITPFLSHIPELEQRQADWQLHFEQFIVEDKGGEAFTLVLARSGREFTVPQDMTILQVIENNKAAKVECLCREGVCGTCETMILEGEADHRDQYYSEEEKASQQSMLICCSRAKSGRLVLDL
ncbi:PDR/VanB family oxidoreductase [Klebsiella variicola]|nr:oxidoreductase [Klebsiella variicola]